MPKMLFPEYERRYNPYINISIAKLRFKRAFKRSSLGIFIWSIIKWIGNK